MFFSEHKKAARVSDVRQIQRKLDLEPRVELSYVYMSSSQLPSSYFTEWAMSVLRLALTGSA